MKTLIQRYRPTRTADNAGGWTNAYGTSVSMYGALAVFSNKTMIQGLNFHSDIDMEDILLIEGAYYRVIGADKTAAMTLKSVLVERIDAPVNTD